MVCHKIILHPQEQLEIFLTKSTAVIATLFIISSISLVILSKGDLEEKQSVIERLEEEKDSNLPKIPDSQK